MKEDDQAEAIESFRELVSLAQTLGYTITGQNFQVIREPNHSHLIGKGKVAEIAEEISNLQPDVIFVDYHLTPLQSRNLEKDWNIPVIDRSGLIIEVFRQHASTNEGKLQVELAKLKYQLPRLTQKNLAYDQQVGGGAVTRGAGERAIELEKRHLKERMRRLEGKIKVLAKNRETRSKLRLRTNMPIVALVGYTNAGKSTLMNALTGANVLIQDKLFSTLDTTVRQRMIGDRKILFVDTVGFIRNLPHELIAAFKSTLEEVLSAWLIVHVFDSADPDYERHIEIAENVLSDLGADCIPKLLVANKADRITDENKTSIAGSVKPDIFISAVEKTGTDELLELVIQKLDQAKA
jgi:GTP-binding protein HflX